MNTSITHHFTAEGNAKHKSFLQLPNENSRAWNPGSDFKATQWNLGQHTRDIAHDDSHIVDSTRCLLASEWMKKNLVCVYVYGF